MYEVLVQNNVKCGGSKVIVTKQVGICSGTPSIYQSVFCIEVINNEIFFVYLQAQLINGCEIMVVTPPCLKRIITARYTNLRRLCHLVSKFSLLSSSWHPYFA